MTRHLLLTGLLLGFFVAFASSARAGSCIAYYNEISFNHNNQQVGGISETYLTYDIAYYYDAGVDTYLLYTNPTQIIDYDFDEGIDDVIFDIICGWMYGVRLTVTTNNYQTNRIVCNDTLHYVRRIFTPTPATDPTTWLDPYNLDDLKYEETEGETYGMIEVPGEYSENNTSPEQVTVLRRTVVCIRTPTVQSVEFQTIDSPVTNDNPALGGGQRMFPDRQSPSDGVNRRIVRVRAQLAPSGGSPTYTSGARVYFRNYDVDDPSIDTIIDPNGNAGNDNMGNVNGSSAGEFSNCAGFENGICYGTSDSNGVASVNFTVTMQPGDNFAVAASTDRNYLMGVGINGTGLQDSAGNQLPTTRARRTDMLTVWRRVHIEVDSMGPAEGNFVQGDITTTTRIRAFETLTMDVTPTSPPGPLEVNRFEGGRLVASGRSFPVECNIAVGDTCNTATSVRIRNPQGLVITLFAGTQFTLYDDDDFNADDGATGDGTLDGDTGEDIPDLQQDWLQDSDNRDLNRFADAYIRPRYDVGDNNGATVFWANVAAPTPEAIRLLYDFDQSATEADPGFWTVYLLSGYQHVITDDEDPNNEDPNGNGVMDDLTVGVVDRSPDASNVRRGQGAVVFFESSSLSECVADHGATFCDLRDTKVHEIGHQFGAEHADGGIMAGMGTFFESASIRAIRGRNYP